MSRKIADLSQKIKDASAAMISLTFTADYEKSPERIRQIAHAILEDAHEIQKISQEPNNQ